MRAFDEKIDQLYDSASSYRDMVDSLGEAERKQVAVSNLVGQVLNGGWIQWADNGYMRDEYDLCWEALTEIWTKAAFDTRVMMEEFRERWDEAEENRSRWSDEDDQYEEEAEEEDLCEMFYGKTVDDLRADLDLWVSDPSKLVKMDDAGTVMVKLVPKKPRVKLVGEDGNAFAILGKVQRALKDAGLKEQAKEYVERATAGDYNELLQVTMEYVDVS